MAALDTLTDKTIKAAIKAAVERGKGRRISDGGGLYLETRPNNVGWWRLSESPRFLRRLQLLRR
jgi:hypothetical protein